MNWQNIIIIVLTVLLLFVWVPVLVISVRKVLREETRTQNKHK